MIIFFKIYGHFSLWSDTDSYFIFRSLTPGIYGSLAGELHNLDSFSFLITIFYLILKLRH